MPLSLQSGSWKEVASASPDVLFESATILNVSHVLSTAVTRAPQKALLTLVLDRFPAVVANSNGRKLVELLVRYGTPRTVSALSKQLLQCDHEVGVLANIYRAVAVREDDSSDSRRDLLSSLVKKGPVTLMSHECLAFAAELALARDEVAESLFQSKKAQVALGEALSTRQTPKDAIHFAVTFLSKCSMNEKASSFVLASIRPALLQEAKHRPRIEVLQGLAQFGDESSVSCLATFVASWSNLGSLVLRADSAKLVAQLIERSSIESARLLAEKIAQVCDMKSIANSTVTTVLGVAKALKRRNLYSGELEGALRAAEYRFSNATMSRYLSTRERIKSRLSECEEEPQRKKHRAA